MASIHSKPYNSPTPSFFWYYWFKAWRMPPMGLNPKRLSANTFHHHCQNPRGKNISSIILNCTMSSVVLWHASLYHLKSLDVLYNWSWSSSLPLTFWSTFILVHSRARSGALSRVLLCRVLDFSEMCRRTRFQHYTQCHPNGFCRSPLCHHCEWFCNNIGPGVPWADRIRCILRRPRYFHAVHLAHDSSIWCDTSVGVTSSLFFLF